MLYLSDTTATESCTEMLFVVVLPDACSPYLQVDCTSGTVCPAPECNEDKYCYVFRGNIKYLSDTLSSSPPCALCFGLKFHLLTLELTY